MGRIIALLYGLVAYVVFLYAFLYAITFTGNIVVPGIFASTIDNGVPVGTLEAIVTNVILMSLFAIQHTVMARPEFKAVWTNFVPKSVERSTFVLFASVLLLLLYALWRPMPEPVWTVTNEIGAMVLNGLFWFGWVFVLVSTFMIDHFELFGLRQVFARAQNQGEISMTFKTPGFYGFVRHPIMLGFIIAFWATPTMTQGHLLFAVVTTAYIFVALQFEERDLIKAFGDRYIVYKKEVGMIIPMRRKSGGGGEPGAPAE